MATSLAGSGDARDGRSEPPCSKEIGAYIEGEEDAYISEICKEICTYHRVIYLDMCSHYPHWDILFGVHSYVNNPDRGGRLGG